MSVWAIELLSDSTSGLARTCVEQSCPVESGEREAPSLCTVLLPSGRFGSPSVELRAWTVTVSNAPTFLNIPVMYFQEFYMVEFNYKCYRGSEQHFPPSNC